MRLVRCAILLVFALSALGLQATRAQVESIQCGAAADSFPTGCREFSNVDSTSLSSMANLRFESTTMTSVEWATEYVYFVAEGLLELDDLSEVVILQRFGDEQVAMQGRFLAGNEVLDWGIVVFRSGQEAGVWGGIVGPDVDVFSTLELAFLKIKAREHSNDDDYGRVLTLLPSLADLPPGFTLTGEGFSSHLAPIVSAAAQENDEPTVEELQATIAALEERAQEPTAAPTRVPTAAPTRVPTARPSTSQPIELLSITSKDAGVGDGTIYVYVEVRNNSNRLYSYVGLEGTCRNSSGGIIGTGYGNTANVAPGSTVVVTMIILNVPGCDKVEVRTDALTALS